MHCSPMLVRTGSLQCPRTKDGVFRPGEASPNTSQRALSQAATRFPFLTHSVPSVQGGYGKGDLKSFPAQTAWLSL